MLFDQEVSHLADQDVCIYIPPQPLALTDMTLCDQNMRGQMTSRKWSACTSSTIS
jgi:hypothetical protein